MLSSLLKFINYWYFRYLMMTELYILEQWERISIHVFLAAVFMLQWGFNYGVVLPFTSKYLSLQMMPDSKILH